MTLSVGITGANGYLGSLFRHALDDAGWRTVGLVRSPSVAGPDARRWALGESDPESFRDLTALVHCAYDRGPRAAAEVWRMNVAGTIDLLTAGRTAGVERILVISSMSAYSGTRQLYGRAKLAIERATLDAGGIAVRPGLVYGDIPQGIAGALARLGRLPIVPVLGAGARQFTIHETDLARAIVRILEHPTWEPEIVGLAQPDPVDCNTLVRCLAGRRRSPWLTLPVPWRLLYSAMRTLEVLRIPLPLRADSVRGLAQPAPSVTRSAAFPNLLESFRQIEPEGQVKQ